MQFSDCQCFSCVAVLSDESSSPSSVHQNSQSVDGCWFGREFVHRRAESVDEYSCRSGCVHQKNDYVDEVWALAENLKWAEM